MDDIANMKLHCAMYPETAGTRNAMINSDFVSISRKDTAQQNVLITYILHSLATKEIDREFIAREF